MKAISILLSTSALVNSSIAADLDSQYAPQQIWGGISNNCQVLPSLACRGDKKSIGFKTSSGNVFIVEQFKDRGPSSQYQGVYSEKPVLEGKTDIASQQNITGIVLRAEKEIFLTESLKFDVGLSVGKLAGSVDADVAANINITTPQMMALTPTGRAISIAPQTSSVSKAIEYRLNGNTYYGGTKLAWAYQFQNSGRSYFAVNQFLNVGVEKIKHGVGMSLGFASNEDKGLGFRAASICQGGNFHSSARYAFALSVCTEKVTRDAFYNKAYSKAETLSQDFNAFIVQHQVSLDKLNAATGGNASIPKTSPSAIMEGLGLNNPYQSLQSSFAMALSVNYEKIHFTVSRIQHVGARSKEQSVTQLILARDF